MLRIDISGYKLSSDNCSKRVRFADAETEDVVLARLAGLIRPSNHVVDIRRKDLSLQARAEYLLVGQQNDVSISLRTHSDVPGWYVRMPAEPSIFDQHLARTVEGHIANCLPHKFTQLDVAGRGILLPARTHQRPARIEISLCSHVDDDGYRAPVFLQAFARGLNIALSEYDSNFTVLLQLHEMEEHEREEKKRLQRQKEMHEALAKKKEQDKSI